MGLATPKQTRPVVRVGADRRYETTGANPGHPSRQESERP